LAIGVGLSFVATLVLLLTLALVCKASITIVKNLQNWRGTRIKAIKIQQAELIGAHTVADVLISVVNYSQILVMLLCVGIYVIQVLNFFPRTQGIASALAANALAPIYSAVDVTLMYLPSLCTLVIIILVTYVVISFARFLFNAIGDKTISFSGFDPDWAEPSYKLARFMIIAFGVIIALPFVPGWESPAFKQVGLVLGVLVSFGSGGVVSNVMAGAVLTYTNAFKIGDRIKIGDCTGDVVEKTLFVTRIRTIKNEIVSIPNGQIVSSNVINYSIMGQTGKLILHTAVTIGYDESYEKLEKLLVSAALATDGIVSDPAPFVLQTSLDDFYVTYEINAYTNRPNGFQQVYSDLHKNIQDKFNAAGVEIMSPQYICLRDGGDTSIPVEYRGENYVTPVFRVQAVDGKVAKK
jgi:Small-conductance mechanosensitive channel